MADISSKINAVSGLSKKLLAAPTFKTGPNDQLATLDVYNKNNAQIVNKIQDIAGIFNSDSTNIMRAGAIISKNFPVITNKVGDLISVNKENLVARISAISRTVSSKVSELGDSFTSGIKDVPLFNEVYTAVGNVYSKVTDVDLGALKPIVSTIQDLAGDANVMQLVDRDSEAALYIGIISEASRNGIPDSYSGVVSLLDNPTVRNTVIRNVLPYAIDTSDVRMLASILDSDTSSMALLSSLDLIRSFSQKYKSGYGYGENEEYLSFESLYASYNKINDIWNKKTVIENGEEKTILDLSKIMDSSNDFKMSLLNYFKIKEDDPDVMLSFINAFSKTTVEEELKKMLPMLVLHDTSHFA